MCEHCSKCGTCPKAQQQRPCRKPSVSDSIFGLVFAIPLLLLTVRATLEIKKTFILRHNQFIEQLNRMPKEKRKQFLKFMKAMQELKRSEQ